LLLPWKFSANVAAMCLVAIGASVVCAEDPAAIGWTPPVLMRLAQLPNEVPLDAPLTAPGENSLTRAEVEALAVAHHPALREAEGRVRAAQGRWLQSGLYPNPTLGYMADEIGNDDTAGMQGGFVSQEIVTAGKLGLGRATTAREVAAAEQRVAQTRLQVVATARMVYFQALAAERTVALSRQLGTISSEAVKTSQLRLEADEISRAALLQTQIANESTALLEQEAANRLDAARRQLAILIGRDPLRDALPVLADGFAEPLPALDWETVRARVLSESPELSEARFQVERARWAVNRATAGRVPNVMTMASVQQDNMSGYTVANVQIGVPLPIFDRKQGDIAEACGDLAAAQAALEQTQWKLEQRLAAALRDYLTARQRVNRYVDSILPATRESLSMFTQAYQQGELDYLQLISAQQTYTEKNLAYLQDLENAWRKWVEIDALLVGELMPGGN
jgi:outer membrane protein, heavy metal efflux system